MPPDAKKKKKKADQHHIRNDEIDSPADKLVKGMGSICAVLFLMN
jgi:hypothetical protein